MANPNMKKTQKITGTISMPKGQHLNWMGGTSFDISNPLTQLRIAATSCFFGEPQYYHEAEEGKVKKGRNIASRPRNLASRSGGNKILLDHLNKTLQDMDPQEWRSMSPKQMMESAIDKAIDYDVEATLQLAANMRQYDYIRVTPQVIMVRAANSPHTKGTNLIRKYAPEIIRRADESATQLAYQLAEFGKPIPSRLKRAWADMLETYDEYALAKYKQEGRVVSMWDVVNLAHPKATPALGKLIKGELSLTGKTWEAIVSEKGSTKEAWTEALDTMGHMALLRNLRNLEQAGIEPKVLVSKLKEGVAGGKQLPFRYWSAYKAVQATGASPVTMDGIEECLVLSLDNLPHFSGRVMSLTDNSGSALGATTSNYGTVQVNEIANLTGVLTGMVAEEGYVGVFGDRLEVIPVRKKSSVFDQVETANNKGRDIGGGTENGIWLFFDKAIKTKEHWDHIFIYSDMQAGHGGLYGVDPRQYAGYQWPLSRNYIDVPALIGKYRAEVNPNVMVFCVQVAGYLDSIVPEFFDKTYILGGWSDGILKFAGHMADMALQQQ